MTSLPRHPIPATLLILAVAWRAYAASDAPAHSEWVYPGLGGRLVYKTTPAGDRIMDFSAAGYGGGGVELPNVPVRKTLRPSGGDDTPAIQAALDAVAAMPLKDGFRGAVLLTAGNFICSNTLYL